MLLFRYKPPAEVFVVAVAHRPGVFDKIFLVTTKNETSGELLFEAIQIAYLTVTCYRKDEIDRQGMLNDNRNLTELSRFRASGTRKITQRCSF